MALRPPLPTAPIPIEQGASRDVPAATTAPPAAAPETSLQRHADDGVGLPPAAVAATLGEAAAPPRTVGEAGDTGSPAPSMTAGSGASAGGLQRTGTSTSPGPPAPHPLALAPAHATGDDGATSGEGDTAAPTEAPRAVQRSGAAPTSSTVLATPAGAGTDGVHVARAATAIASLPWRTLPRRLSGRAPDAGDAWSGAASEPALTGRAANPRGERQLGALATVARSAGATAPVGPSSAAVSARGHGAREVPVARGAGGSTLSAWVSPGTSAHGAPDVQRLADVRELPVERLTQRGEQSSRGAWGAPVGPPAVARRAETGGLSAHGGWARGDSAARGGWLAPVGPPASAGLPALLGPPRIQRVEAGTEPSAPESWGSEAGGVPRQLATVQRQFRTGSVPVRRAFLGRQRARALTLPPADVPPATAPADAVADVADPEPPEEQAAEAEVADDAASAVVAPPAPAPAASAPQSPKQLAALADALYPQLMRRLRHEVLLDRERRGIRTDRRLP